jgi:hypothetical protein
MGVIGQMWRRWRVKRDLRTLAGELSQFEQACVLIRVIEQDKDLRQALRRALGISVAGTPRTGART